MPCTNDCRPDAMLDKWAYARFMLGSPEDMAATWRADGVNYVLIWEAGYQAVVQLALNRFTAEDDQALRQLVRRSAEIYFVDLGGVYQLYRLKG